MRRILSVAILTLSACSSGSPITAVPDGGDGSFPAASLPQLQAFGCAVTHDETVASLCSGKYNWIGKMAGTCRGRRSLFSWNQYYSLTCVYDSEGHLAAGEYCGDTGPCQTLDFEGCERPTGALVCPADGGVDG